MAGKPPTSSYAVMGLLAIAPMSGYDLAQAADRSIAHFWPISKTQVYGELARLEELGYVEGTAVAQERLPDKRVFNLTPAGDKVLDQWLENAAPGGASFRSPFLLRLFFGHRISRERLREMVDEERRGAEVERDHLGQIVAMLAPVTDAAHARMAALYGQRLAEAVVAWADEVKSQLPATPARMHPRRKAAPTARRLFREAPPRPREGHA